MSFKWIGTTLFGIPAPRQLPKSTNLYPGLGLPLRENKQKDYGFFPIGAHGSCRESDSDPLSVRELAMMSVMESFTDKPDWHTKMFDDTIVARWREEALGIADEHFWALARSGKVQRWEADGDVNLDPDYLDEGIKMPKNIMSDCAFESCVQELRSKAKYFGKTGLIPTLDACATVAKSDTLVSNDLHQELLSAFQTLQADQADDPDWHPNSKDMVRNLIHPSMYPLVYRRSRVFQEEVVGVQDAIAEWAGRGEVISGEDEREMTESRRDRIVGSDTVPPSYWSKEYQWLPSNVAFQDDDTVRFTSYVYNLHPTKYPAIYRTLERLIETSLPMWDQCLTLAAGYKVRDGPVRTQERVGIPSDPDDENHLNWIPSDPKECADAEVSREKLEDEGWDDVYVDEEDGGQDEMLAEFKWKVLRKPKLPEARFEDVDYTPVPGKRLIDKFRKSGLQVIVKIASIELTPQKPYFPEGSWHVEGQMNEHICATALYYLDSENITPSSLSFRMQTSAYLYEDERYNVGQDSYHWMESNYGTHFSPGSCSPCLQNYGSVETKGRRLLAFPNVFQHRVSPFRLADPTKPGHRRFIALWLVDPHKRIISTANVPPQQMSWCFEAILGSTSGLHEEALSRLPPGFVDFLKEKSAALGSSTINATLSQELFDLAKVHMTVDRHAVPMSIEEAKQHRLKLMQERSAHKRTAEDWWQQHSYGFCEH